MTPHSRATIWERTSRSDGQAGVRLHLHRGQTAAWRATFQDHTRFVFVLAGSQAGKTAFGPWWLEYLINQRGGGDYLAVTASYDLFKLKMLPEIRTVFEELRGIGRYWAGERVMELRDPSTGEFRAKRADDPMWGRIILRSAAAPAGLEAATAKGAWLDECGQDEFSLESWEAVQRRLALYRGEVLGTTTLYNTGWLKSQVYDRWVEGDQDYRVIQFPSTVNPMFPRAEFLRMRRIMPDWRFRMFYQGLFARPAGLIYSSFSDSMLVDPFPIPPYWKRVVGIDFGGANQALVWLAEDPETGIWYLYDESLAGGLTTAEHCGRVLAIEAELREAMEIARAADTEDELAEEYVDLTYTGGSPGESQQRRDWAAEGVYVQQPPIKDLEPGLDRGIGLVKTGRFRLFRTCRGMLDELGTYRRKLDDEGQPTEEIVDKRKFHRLDAYRYAASWITAGYGFDWAII